MESIKRGIEHNTHPGEIFLNDIVKPNNLTIKETASLLGINYSTLSNVVNGKSAINPEMAIRISIVFGGVASFWVNLQSAYDLRKAEKEWVSQNISLDKFKFDK